MSTTARLKDASPTSSGTSTPVNDHQTLHEATSSPTTSSYLPALSHAVTGFLRRLSSNDPYHLPTSSSSSSDPDASVHPGHPRGANTFPSDKPNMSNNNSGLYTPPLRTASPFHPPPLYPLVLRGHAANTDSSAQLLTRAIAEEIRLLVPPRLQLVEDWNLVYSLDQDGVSLGTLYAKCEALRGLRNGFVLVVRDGDGGLFGAYLTEAPHPAPHYYGTGECFLWRASILSNTSQQNHLLNLPPPPSADTTNAQRSTTLLSSSSSSLHNNNNHQATSASTSTSSLAIPPSTSTPATGTSTPDRLRFKAFPYSGVNDYMMLCEHSYLSIGGGDGHYGLWLDDNLERGISSTCPTFGNEPLSDEGEKFEILGVEVWTVGSLPGVK